MKTRKLFPLLLSAAVACCVALPAMAFAETGSKTVENDAVVSTDTTNVDVYATVTKADTTGTSAIVYRAEITWETPSLTATQATNVNNYEWDAANTKYVQKSGDDATTTSSEITAASEGTVKITVTNKSNADIYYAISEADQNGYTLSHTKASLASTKIDAADEAGVADGARASMQAGSTDATALTGAPVAGDEFSDTIKITAAPVLTATASNVLVARYTVTISSSAIS